MYVAYNCVLYYKFQLTAPNQSPDISKHMMDGRVS